MSLRSKLILSVLFLTITPVLIVGYIAYKDGQHTIEKKMIDHLISMNTSREAQLNNWIQGNIDTLEILVNQPFFRERFPEEIAAHSLHRNDHAPDHEEIDRYLLPLVREQHFLELSLLRYSDGLVIHSTTHRQEGKFLDHQPFFREGKKKTFVQNVYYDLALQKPVMTIGTPVTDSRGNCVAVLAGQLNLKELSAVMEKRNPLVRTEDSYLVNTFNYFITEPQFGNGFALKKTVRSPGVNAALAQGSGVDFYPDYRGIPVIGAYNWIDQWQLALITEIDQEEAYEPIARLKRTIAFFAVGVALLAILIGWAVALKITKPLDLLLEATEELGKGNLEVSIDLSGRDELSILGRSFSAMAKKLNATLISRDKLAAEIRIRKQVEKRLEAVKNDLERSNKDLQQFAYVASHDLQEPLRMVSSYTQLLGERYRDQLDEKANKFIHYAVDGAIRMQRLIQDLLMFSRVNTHGHSFQAVDSHAALGQAIANLQAAITETGALVTCDELPEVYGDETQLTQVFQNLIANGIKFQKDRRPTVHISALRTDTAWQFSVADNGIGIEDAYREKLFIIFQRLHTRQEYPGTGIGLALCKQIITRHSGQIWFTSEPGQGTTFYFTIPFLEKER